MATSEDEELAAASPGWNHDLSVKRNLGLVLARLAGWTKLMFLDDDIYGVTEDDVAMLAAALEDHSVSALIPAEFPDNSVACHAHRLSGGKQDVFASASGIGVRCDRDDLGFFPNLYNEDWFFFADEAASHGIAKTGESRQRRYDPFDNPRRAALEEFGDLLAEGLYARLDRNQNIWDVDTRYWRDFIQRRTEFHQRVAEALGHVEDRDKEEAVRASNSIRAAQDQLARITPELCQKFVRLWYDDREKWRSYVANLPRLDSLRAAFKYLDIDLVACHPASRSGRGT
jgi:glycosyltransferase involved in cell wall biosynthesis